MVWAVLSISVLGSQCPGSTDCTTLANSECGTGGTCICSDGFTANVDSTACESGMYIIIFQIIYLRNLNLTFSASCLNSLPS